MTSTAAIPQGRLNENGPWFSACTPLPEQEGQIFGVVPGLAPLPPHVEQAASLVIFTVVVIPLIDSKNGRVNVFSKSFQPRPLLDPPCPNKPPNKSSM